MPLFTSPRERRLWTWALVVVVAIAAGLVFARAFAGLLGDGIAATVLFVVGFLMVLATIVTQGLRSRPSGAEIGIGLGVAAAYVLVLVRMSIPAERTHVVEYGVLAVLIHEALKERARHGRGVPRPALLAMAFASLVGIVDEIVQVFLPARVFDPRDILFNVLAAVMAIVASLSLAWARRRATGDRRV